MRISWINAPDGRVIDTRQGLTGTGVVEQLQAWMTLTGEDDLIVVEDDRREATEPLGGPVPGVNGSHLPEVEL
jgi:hypothetical protein